MITKIQGYKSSDNAVHPTLADAQMAELAILFNNGNTEWSADTIAQFIFTHSPKVMDILSTTERSKVRARKINGATKKRTPKHIADQHTLPLEEK